MTIPIRDAAVQTDRLVDRYSRYLNGKVIYYGEQNFITFETYLRKRYVPNGQESVMVITKGVEYRPDLVAYDVYGIPDPWWNILEANNMKDIWEFQAGKTILLPSMF